MAVDAGLALQTAVYVELAGDGTLSTLINGVFDFVPQDTAYPYVTIGDDQYAWFGAMTQDGGEYSIQVDTWTQAEGRSSCKTIMSNIARVLHNGSLAIAGNTHISTRLEFQETFKEEDGLTYHGVQRFQVLLHE